MSSDAAFEIGLLSPVTVGHDALVSDRAVLAALVQAEVALVRAYAGLGAAPQAAADALAGVTLSDRDAAALAAASVSGGNPVIPLVRLLRERVPAEVRDWVHRGATSQDILDTALMIVARQAAKQVRLDLLDVAENLARFADAHRDDVVVARTLTQHAVPTTLGLRAATWLRGVDRVLDRLGLDVENIETPVQLGGAAGTRASFVEVLGSPARAEDLVIAFARETRLFVAPAPWQVTRWPVVELGDVLVQAIDAVGKMAADIATLSRTEIGELTEGSGGGSSAMPQKQNPVEAVLIRSAALRAPGLSATLHLASALAVDERPDGAWHAEWPTLRELMRIALGATANAVHLTAQLRFDPAAAAANLAASRGLILAERLSLRLTPVLGRDAVAAIVAAVADGADLALTVRDALAAAGADGIDVPDLLDPARYTGMADLLIDEDIARHLDQDEEDE